MSGIAGIFNRNSEPVNPALLKQMTDVIAHRGPDGIGSWIDGQFGASQLLLATTPESVEEQSPMCNARSSLCMVFDGRVDNRQDLANSLLSHGICCRTDTDMELVLKAFELWGASCLEKILGDFAFAIWDKYKQQLFCARDILGFRPFYYSVAQDYFAFGSELRQIVQHPAVSRRANLNMMVEYLAIAIQNFDETLYTAIKRLPPAHYLLVDKNRVHLRRYWELEQGNLIRYSTDGDYVEHYLELLRTSTECRLRSSGAVGASMSGGLDSTSIVGMTQKIYAEQGSNKSITTFSITFPGRECDESSKIEQMVRFSRADSFIYPFTKFEAEPPWQDQVRRTFELPDSPLAMVDVSSLKEAKSRQIKVMLDGTGADAVLGGSAYPYLQALRCGEVSFMWEFFCRQKSQFGFKYASSTAFRNIVWPLIPRWLRKEAVSRRPLANKMNLLQAEFVSATHLMERLKSSRSDWRFNDLAQWHRSAFVYNGYNRFELEAFERQHAEFGIEQRHPFCDRRMLEFGNATPEFRHLRNGKRKALVLEGSEKLIPAELQAYPNYGHFSNSFQEMLKLPFVEKTFRSLKLADAGFVSKEKLLQQYWGVMKRSGEGLEIHCDDYGRLLPLMTVLALEFWFGELGSELPSF